MNFKAKELEHKDTTVSVEVTVDASEVDRAVAKTYKEISEKYNFQGFRKGHTPRPVIDNAYGKEAVLAGATNEVLQRVEPLVLSELDIVSVGEQDYSDVEPVKEHADYTFTFKIPVAPEAELSSYDPVAIDMPPEEVTESEIDNQIELLLMYQTRPVPVKEGSVSKKENYVEITFTDKADAPEQKRVFKLDNTNNPKGINKELLGKKVGDTVSVSLGEDDEAKVKASVAAIYNMDTPKLDDELAKNAFGFDSVKALKEGVAQEIQQKKAQDLPTLKHNRCVEALCERLKEKKVDETFENFTLRNLSQDFMNNLARQGQTVDSFLSMQGITANQLMDDLKAQAHEFSLQALALDAFANHKKVEVSENDIRDEFLKAGCPEDKLEEEIKHATEDGRMPEIKQSIKRHFAAQILVEQANVTIVDVTKEKESKK